MKKIIAFIILVILVIVMIVLSYNFYSNNNKNAAKNKLNNSLKVTKKKTSDVINNVTKNDSDNNSDSNNSNSNTTNNSSSTNDVDVTVEEDTQVPDTASDDNNGYIRIDHYVVSVDKSTMNIGDSSNIYVKIYPKNASEKDVSFVSSDESIVKVNAFGKMKALRSGEVTITIKVKNCDDYNLKVNVK